MEMPRQLFKSLPFPPTSRPASLPSRSLLPHTRKIKHKNFPACSSQNIPLYLSHERGFFFLLFSRWGRVPLTQLTSTSLQTTKGNCGPESDSKWITDSSSPVHPFDTSTTFSKRGTLVFYWVPVLPQAPASEGQRPSRAKGQAAWRTGSGPALQRWCWLQLEKWSWAPAGSPLWLLVPSRVGAASWHLLRVAG